MTLNCSITLRDGTTIPEGSVIELLWEDQSKQIVCFMWEGWVKTAHPITLMNACQ